MCLAKQHHRLLLLLLLLLLPLLLLLLLGWEARGLAAALLQQISVSAPLLELPELHARMQQQQQQQKQQQQHQQQQHIRVYRHLNLNNEQRPKLHPAETTLVTTAKP